MSLIPGLIIFIAVLIFLLLIHLEIVFAILGLVRKDFSLFKKFGKYLLWDVGAIFVVMTLWGLLNLFVHANN